MKIVLSNLSIPVLVHNEPNVQIQFERLMPDTDAEKKEEEKKKALPGVQPVKKVGERVNFILWDENREDLAKELSTKKKYKITIEEM